MPRSWQKPSLLPWRLVALFLLLAAGIGTAGYAYFLQQLDQVKRQNENTLNAIAELKANQLAEWRRERIAEAKSILSTSFMPKAAELWILGDRRDDQQRDALLAWMAAPRHAHHYSQTYLLDSAGKTLLAFPRDGQTPDNHSRTYALEALRDRKVILQDFHAVNEHSPPHLDLCIPLFAAHKGKAAVEIGILVMEIDPERFLYPFIQTWPTPSKTGETLLVRRDGENILYLNELRHRKNTALKLRIPLARRDLPSSMALNGMEGVTEGKDYRGKEVLAALKIIPGSPWALVAQMDKDELYSPLHQQARLIALLVAALILASGGMTIFLWRRQQMRFHLARHQMEEEALQKANAELEARVAERTRKLMETSDSLRHEIAQHRLTESALQKSLEELAHSNADLEQFAYIASHDLQEPLRMVASYVQLLARRYRDRLDQNANDFIGYAVEGVTRMQRLINDLLTFSLVGNGGDLEMTDCNQVLAEVLMNLRPLIDENQAVVTQDLLPVFPAIHSQIGQLLQNLISNAVKFRREERPEIHVSARHEENAWIISVRDNGIGIEPQYFEQIFMIFKRLHSREKYSGTGIGLAICKRIVERHHGRIWVESEYNKGTTIHFSLPDNNEGDKT